VVTCHTQTPLKRGLILENGTGKTCDHETIPKIFGPNQKRSKSNRATQKASCISPSPPPPPSTVPPCSSRQPPFQPPPTIFAPQTSLSSLPLHHYTPSMSFNLSASAALPPPLSTVTVPPQLQAQDEAAEPHCDAVQAPEAAAIARVDDSSAALGAGALQHTPHRLSPQLCSVVFRSRSAALMCASMAAQLRLPRDRHDVLSALGCRGVCVYEVGVSGEERGRAMGGGGVGLLVLRMTATGGACGRDVKRMMMSIVRHVAAVHAAATPEAFFERGQRAYDEGLYASAAESWGRAVALKHAHAHALLSTMLFEGRLDVPVDYPRAFELAAAGAGMGCAHSKGALGRCYGAGFGVAADYGKAVSLGRESAAAGSCIGQFLLARCSYSGRGVAQDDAEAVRLWRLAAEQGYAGAQFNLGAMFANGRGVARDRAEAIQWFRLAAAQGHVNATAALEQLGA